ncbi:MAG TPA: hypothetical protein VFC78_14430, partial [Tepidisphaeraceae bacterium]|nr:hypothetical protein [Tepidisphaeraceae bacterium]
ATNHGFFGTNRPVVRQKSGQQPRSGLKSANNAEKHAIFFANIVRHYQFSAFPVFEFISDFVLRISDFPPLRAFVSWW